MPITDRFAKNAYFQIGNMRGKPLFSLLFAVLILVSCGFGQPSSSVRDANQRTATMDTDIGLDELRELARPPSMGGNTVESTGVRTINGEFKDVNQRQLLFEEKIRNTDDRLDRIENAVQNLSDDFEDVSPAIQRLVAIENDLRELHDQLSLLISGADGNEIEDENFVVVAPEIETAEAPSPVKPTSIKPARPPKDTSYVPVSNKLPNIRAATYPDKIRIVFETAQKQKFSRNFDQENQLLVINSPIAFSHSLLETLKKSSRSIIDVTMSEGNDIAIMTKGMSRVSAGEHIGQTSKNKNYRYYVDVFK